LSENRRQGDFRALLQRLLEVDKTREKYGHAINLARVGQPFQADGGFPNSLRL
jgi:hypothetical protein